MMVKIFHRAVIICLAVFMIMATGGVSIYHHLCRCAGESKASIFLEASCDHDMAPPLSSCCHAEEAPACCADQPAENKSNTCQHNDCCQDSETFLKISDDFTVSLEKLSLKCIVTLIQVLTGNNLLYEPLAFISPLPEFNDTSPLLAGRELVTSLHQLKIAHILV